MKTEKTYYPKCYGCGFWYKKSNMAGDEALCKKCWAKQEEQAYGEYVKQAEAVEMQVQSVAQQIELALGDACMLCQAPIPPGPDLCESCSSAYLIAKEITPPIIAKSAYAKEKAEWIKGLAEMAEKKLGAGAGDMITSVATEVLEPPTELVAMKLEEPLTGKLEMGEPVVGFEAQLTAMKKALLGVGVGVQEGEGESKVSSEDTLEPPHPVFDNPPPKLFSPITKKILALKKEMEGAYAPPQTPPSWKKWPSPPVVEGGPDLPGIKTLPIPPGVTLKVEGGEIVGILTPKEGAPDDATPQKVKGLMVLGVVFPHSRTLEFQWFTDEGQLKASKSGVWKASHALFFRPAPSVPCHGFIDSRACYEVTPLRRKRAAAALLREVLERDPGGGLIVCSFIPSKRNAVVTPVGITLGDGHDGATAGKNTTFIPLVEGKQPLLPKDRKLAKIGAKEMPFVEVVFPDPALADPVAAREDVEGYMPPVVVQLRAGPQLPSDPDFIPASKVMVKEVYELQEGESLDGWPAKAKGLAGTTGLVVYHKGGSLQSHYGANAALAGLPFVTSHLPYPGEILVRKGKALAPASRLAFTAGFLRGLEVVLFTPTARSDGIAFVLTVGHSIAQLQQGMHAWWVGLACAFMVRFGMAASVGELRHSKRRKLKGEGGGLKSRAQLFDEVLNKGGSTLESYTTFRARLVEAHGAFRHEHWPGGYGGKAWADCALATIALDRAVMDAFLTPAEDCLSLTDVGAALHGAINQAHNNGWWMNKFVYGQMCDEAAVGRLSVVVQGLRWFEALPMPTEVGAELEERVDALLKGQVLIVERPARALAIAEAQMRMHWNNEPLVVHIQYRLVGSTGTAYSRLDVTLDEGQVALLQSHFAQQAKGKSWGSETMEYYALDTYPGSNVVGVNTASGFVPITALKG
jgi:hypothetical protein